MSLNNSSIKNILDSMAGGVFMALLIFQLPLSIYGFMFMFDWEWWKAGIAAVVMTGIPLVNIFGTIGMSLVGVYGILVMLFG
ncbi:hypothetical protein HLB35_14065 [Halomonas sp. TBZ9]|uniref:Uncharacterized protein n=1 Tax=Vreelandella azerica TaxID=2732867 RepID=A0A7Y3TYV2_9GAMM|nr:hypothetical protein [Halomonas azerica]NOG32600.1 hypothetical protein [Halomonas azerica]